MRLQNVILLASAAALFIADVSATRNLKSRYLPSGNSDDTDGFDLEERMPKFNFKNVFRRGSGSGRPSQDENIPAPLPVDEDPPEYKTVNEIIDTVNRAHQTKEYEARLKAIAAQRAEEYEARLKALFPEGTPADDIFTNPDLINYIAELNLEYGVAKPPLAEFFRRRFQDDVDIIKLIKSGIGTLRDGEVEIASRLKEELFKGWKNDVTRITEQIKQGYPDVVNEFKAKNPEMDNQIV